MSPFLPVFPGIPGFPAAPSEPGRPGKPGFPRGPYKFIFTNLYCYIVLGWPCCLTNNETTFLAKFEVVNTTYCNVIEISLTACPGGPSGPTGPYK